MRIEKITAKDTASPLQSHCIPFAVLLHAHCSTTATVLQSYCKPHAVHCKKRAELCSRKELITKIIAPMKEVCSTIEMETKWA